MGRIQRARDTDSRWRTANPVLMEGEVALIKGGSQFGMKFGDGESKFSGLADISPKVVNTMGVSSMTAPSQRAVTEKLDYVTSIVSEIDNYQEVI